MDFKKLPAALTTISLVIAGANLSFANPTDQNDDKINKDIISQSLQNFSTDSLSGTSESIKQLKAFYNAAKNHSYIKTMTTGISFADLLIKEYPAYKSDANVSLASKQTKIAATEIYNALQNVSNIPVMDQHLLNYKGAFDKAWEARIDFWQNKDSSEKAQDFNHFINYMTIYGLSNIQKQGMDRAKDTYVSINAMAYQLQIDAQDAYAKTKQETIDNLYNITPEILKSNIQLLRQNATISGVTQAIIDVNNALESALHVNTPIKVFGVTIFTLKLPQSVIDYAHKSEKQAGLTDSYQALMFMMKTDISTISDYNAMVKASDDNVFAKMMVSFAQTLAKHFAIQPEQAYWAILNQTAIQLNKHIA
ncbi:MULTISPECIES: hypothetical protein [Cysteiniphilum]|uniref:Uncharacterized protein n=1 Tax=Cysteiniphilum litorale TaxID=2056700 RepID=A0A8J2Z5J0_9GAMM|nr:MULTISPECIES: hypothetical protein [Cysteiniphilum]GGG01191.1 hypothetical protein GCM10010995_18290 [Cysteiniphilum litorale]